MDASEEAFPQSLDEKALSEMAFDWAEDERESYARGAIGLGVIFDSDGVLVDTEPLSQEAFRRAYADVDVKVDEEDIRSVVGRTDEAAVKIIYDRLGHYMPLQEFNERHQRHYEEIVLENGIDVFPGVVDLLNELEENEIAYALASSARMEKIDLNLESSGLIDRFTIIVSGTEVRFGKPDPEIFLLAAKRLTLPPDRCIVIEDSGAGIEAARRAGMPCVAVTNTFSGRSLSEATCVVRSLEQVNLSMLRKMSGSLPTGRP